MTSTWTYPCCPPRYRRCVNSEYPKTNFQRYMLQYAKCSLHSPHRPLLLRLPHPQSGLIFCTDEGSHFLADADSSRRRTHVVPVLCPPLHKRLHISSVVPIACLGLPPRWWRPRSLLRSADSVWHSHASARPPNKGLPCLRYGQE